MSIWRKNFKVYFMRMLLLNRSPGNFSISITYNNHPIHHRPTENCLHMPDRDATGTKAAVLCKIGEPSFTLVAFWVMKVIGSLYSVQSLWHVQFFSMYLVGVTFN